MEINLLYKVNNHPNIMKIHTHFSDKKNIYLILEFCSGGSLLKKLYSNDDVQFSESQIKIYSK